MRIVYKVYADGSYVIYQTDENGENRKVLKGKLPAPHSVARISSHIEVICDDEEEAIARTSNALSTLSKDIKVAGASPSNHG